MHVNRCCNSWRQKCDEELEAEKILKYKDPITENEHMWNVKAKVIPVMGMTGTISKSLRQYQSNILGKYEIKELQKKAVLGTAHIL